jgi:lysophospholipase L1-like esterase
MRRALFWMLFPLVIQQALRVRRTAPRFAGASGADDGVCGVGTPQLRILAIGDSIVAGVGAGTMDGALAGATAAALSQRLAVSVAWRAVGKIGAGVEKVHSQLVPLIPDDSYDAILVSVGVNDITGLRRSARWASALGEFLDTLRQRFPQATIVLAGIPPLEGFPLLPFPLRWIFGLRGKTFDNLARRGISRRENMLFLPLNFDPRPEKFSADGFHPSPASYAEFGKIISDKLVTHLAAVRRAY